MYSTVYLYNKSVEGSSMTPIPSSDWNFIEQLITDASILLDDYLGRTLGKQDYLESRSVMNGLIFTEHYPINSIEYIGMSQNNAIQINIDESIIRKVDFIIGDEDINMKVLEQDVSKTTETFDISTYNTFTLLASGINQTPGISATVFEDDLTDFVVRSNLVITKNSVGYIYKFFEFVPQYEIFSDTNMIECRTSREFIQSHIKYNAGYVLPEDNADHTELANSPTLPAIITYVVNKMVQLMLQNVNKGISSGEFIQEKLGDYSYTLNTERKNALFTLLDGYNKLDKYKNKVLVGLV